MGAEFDRAVDAGAELREGCGIEIPGQIVDRVYTPRSIEALSEMVRAAAAEDEG